MPAVRVVRQRGRRRDLEVNLAENAEILEDGFEIDMKISGQFVSPQNFEGGIIGTRFGQVEATRR
jgi:hypothetical protein